MLSRLKTLFKEWKQNRDNGKEFCKINREVAEEYASILNLPREEDVIRYLVSRTREELLRDSRFLDGLKREIGDGIGRRAFIATLASLGVIGAVKAVDAKTVIGGKGINTFLSVFLPMETAISPVASRLNKSKIMLDLRM